ncbi:hypothetical protein GCM10017688_16350 [Streptomyces ramulosus]
MRYRLTAAQEADPRGVRGPASAHASDPWIRSTCHMVVNGYREIRDNGSDDYLRKPP